MTAYSRQLVEYHINVIVRLIIVGNKMEIISNLTENIFKTEAFNEEKIPRRDIIIS